MSLINQLNASTAYKWSTVKPVDIVNKASALHWKLMGKAVKLNNWLVKPHETVDGGLMTKIPLKYEVSHHGVYGANTIINQSKKNILDAARFGWGGAYGANTLDLDDATQNTGEAAMVDLTKTYVDDIIIAIQVDLADQIIAKGSSPAMSGLGNLFDPDTAVAYGSVTEAEMSAWKANVITTANVQIGMAALQLIMRTPDMGDFAGMLPNFGVTSAKLRDAYELTLHPQRIYRDTDMVKVGWDNIMHKQMVIVSDTRYTSTDYFDALNLNTLSLRAHKDFNFTTPVWESKRVLGYPDTMTAESRFRGNLYCNNRQLNVRHTGLVEPV